MPNIEEQVCFPHIGAPLLDVVHATNLSLGFLAPVVPPVMPPLAITTPIPEEPFGNLPFNNKTLQLASRSILFAIYAVAVMVAHYKALFLVSFR